MKNNMTHEELLKLYVASNPQLTVEYEKEKYRILYFDDFGFKIIPLNSATVSYPRVVSADQLKPFLIPLDKISDEDILTLACDVFEIDDEKKSVIEREEGFTTSENDTWRLWFWDDGNFSVEDKYTGVFTTAGDEEINRLLGSHYLMSKGYNIGFDSEYYINLMNDEEKNS